MIVKTIDNRTLSEQVQDILIAQIQSGDLKPGDRLVELKIAADMQTSQAPVREALRSLESLGLIEMRRNRGAIVRGMDEAELRHIYEVRGALEALAITSAQDTSTLAQDLRGLCDVMSEAIAENQLDRFVELNHRFHRTIVESSGNTVLIDTWTKLNIRAYTAVNVGREKRPLEFAAEEHFEITRALESGDRRAAADLLSKHIARVVAKDEEPN